jgi:hypothetical protein
VSRRPAAHDGGLLTPHRDGSPAVDAERIPGGLLPVGYDLETFWPSRRSHAYDEFCR